MKKLFLFILLECGIVSIKAQTVIASWNFADTNMTGFTTYHTYREYNYTNGTYVYGRDFIRKTDSLMGDNNDGYIYLPLDQVSGHGSFYMDVQHTAYLQFPAVANPTNYPIEVRFRQKYRKKNDRCFVDCYYSNHFMSVEINQNVQRDSIGPDSIAIVLPSQVSSADSIIIQIRSYMQGSNLSLSGYYWAIDDVEIVTPPTLPSYNINVNRNHASIWVDGKNLCANDTVMYESTPAEMVIIPEWGYSVQSVFLDNIDVTSDLIGLGSEPTYITESRVNCNMDIIPYHTACWIFNMPIDANHTLEVNTVAMPNVNISINCAGLVSGVDVNGIPTCNSSVSSIYGSHDTIIIHTQTGSMRPKIFQIIDTASIERYCDRINDTTYRMILYSVSSDKTYTITASPQPQLSIVNENGGYIYAFIYNDNNQIEIDNIHDTVVGVQYENAVAQVRFVTFLPNYENTNLYVNDTNAHRLVRLYLDGTEIVLDSATDYFTITHYLDAIEYILTIDMDTAHSIRAVYGNYYIRFTATGISEDEEKGSVIGGGNYPTGTEIIFTASANYGYHFDHWSDYNTDNPRTLILNNDTTLTAFFSPNSYLISTSSNDESKGTVNGGGFYDYNTDQTLYAEPTEGNHFVNWMDGSTDNPRTIHIYGDSLYTAFFAIDTLTVNVTQNNIAYGSVAGSGEYTYGSPCTIEASPYSGYVFVRWSNGVTYNPYTFAVLTNMDIEAVFAPEGSIHNVTVQVQPAGTGTVTGGGPYANGETVTLEAIPNDGYHFVRWQDDVTDNPRTIFVTTEMAFTAFFEADDTQGIVDANSNGIQVWAADGSIIIEGYTDEAVHVYDMMGREVASSISKNGTFRIHVRTGVYLVKIGNHPIWKVVVLK